MVELTTTTSDVLEPCVLVVRNVLETDERAEALVALIELEPVRGLGNVVRVPSTLI